jgi:hypothetical protein
MNMQEFRTRLDSALRQRLVTAQPGLRAMATADSVEWVAPEFATGAQQRAVNLMVRACHEARIAVHGDAPYDELDRIASATEEVCHFSAEQRLSALDRAVADERRATQLLLHAGLMAVVNTRQRDVQTGADDPPVYAEIRFASRAVHRLAATTSALPVTVSRREEAPVQTAKVITPKNGYRILPPKCAKVFEPESDLDADRRWLATASFDKETRGQ